MCRARSTHPRSLGRTSAACNSAMSCPSTPPASMLTMPRLVVGFPGETEKFWAVAPSAHHQGRLSLIYLRVDRSRRIVAFRSPHRAMSLVVPSRQQPNWSARVRSLLYDDQKSACILTDVKSRKSQGIIPEPWQVIDDDAIHHPTACVVCCVSCLDVVYRTPDSSQPDAQKKYFEWPPPGFQKGI
jgi:hypothetical protein